MQTMNMEQIFEQADIFGMAHQNGITPESIVAYGVYGSQAVGLANENSDFDVFVIIDEGIKKNRHMINSDAGDCKFIPVTEWGKNTDMLFDVLALGTFIFPEMPRNGSDTPTKNPWAAYILNTRPSLYEALKAAQSSAKYARIRRDEMQTRESYDPVSMYKREKLARKQTIRTQKMEDYLYSIFTTDDARYTPYFTAVERAEVFNF